MDKINEITSECFVAVSQLRELDSPALSPELIHDRMRGFVENMRNRAREQGIAGRDADDMAYALVALIDEVAMGKPDPLRSFWMGRLLQLELFNDALAGDGFFTKLADLRRDPRRADVLRVYYQCLLLGFQGKYAIRGGDLELMRLIDSLKPEIERHVETPEILSPAGEPPDEPLLRAAGKNTFLWIALGVFALAIAVFVGLRVTLSHQIADLSAHVDEIAH